MAGRANTDSVAELEQVLQLLQLDDPREQATQPLPRPDDFAPGPAGGSGLDGGRLATSLRTLNSSCLSIEQAREPKRPAGATIVGSKVRGRFLII